MTFKNIAYCKLNLEFDRNTFTEEYDRHILPNSIPIANGQRSWDLTRSVNNHWKMVDPSVYDLCDVQSNDSTEIINRGVPAWLATSLIELKSAEPRILMLSKIGSVAVRNALLNDGDYKFKDQYKDLEITKWIKQLPFSKIIGVRCVSLKENTFASIHRDENSLVVGAIHNSLEGNKLWNAGFVSITLNVSDGGQPIFYSLNSNINKAYTVNDQVYMFNDYCPHGVPVVSSRRRQIRVTGIPTEDFLKVMCTNTIHYII